MGESVKNSAKTRIVVTIDRPEPEMPQASFSFIRVGNDRTVSQIQ